MQSQEKGILMIDSEMDGFVAEAIKAANESKLKKEQEAKQNKSVKTENPVFKRITDDKGFKENDAKMLAIMYVDLAPNDEDGEISAKMMSEFIRDTIKKEYPDEYETKIKPYYDMENPMPEFKKEKAKIWVKNFWKRFRTVENAYKYSKSFRELAKRIAPKLDAPTTMGVVERCKWLRLWVFVIRDQAMYWYDVEHGLKLNMRRIKEYDKNLELTPELMVKYEKAFFSKIPENGLMLDMLKAFISIYPEKIQKDIKAFAEFEKNDASELNAGYVRKTLKKELFPSMWISSMWCFCMKNGVSEFKVLLLSNAVEAFKKGLNKYNTFLNPATDPFKGFSTRNFKCYKLGRVTEDGIEKTFAVTSQNELQMYVEVYKWLLLHPDFEFGVGSEKKTLEGYGYENLLVDPEEEQKELFSEMKQKIAGSQKEAKKVAEALKRIKIFGEKTASESDIKYLKFFKYMLKNEPNVLPKNMVNVYGKVFM